MKFSGDYNKLQIDCINIWKQFSSFNFKKEINSIKPTFSLFSKVTNKKFYFNLGCFNYIWERGSNVYMPNNISTSKPNTKDYYEYVFSNNVLRLVKHFSNGIQETVFLIIDNYIFQLHDDFQFLVMWVIGVNYQITVKLCGLEIDYFERIDENEYKGIFINLLNCIEETFELKNNIFHRLQTNKRILRRKDEIEFLNKNLNPFPFPDKFINKNINTLKEAGFDEEK